MNHLSAISARTLSEAEAFRVMLESTADALHPTLKLNSLDAL